MDWTVVTEMNPGNVPRRVKYANQKFMPLSPASHAAVTKLRYLMRDNGIGMDSMRLMFGEGFRSLDLLSGWAVSWAIDQIQEFERQQGVDEEQAKRRIADHYLAKFPQLRRPDDDG